LEVHNTPERLQGRRLVICFALAAAVAFTATARASGPRSYGTWCRAREPASWSRVLSRHVVPLSRTTKLVPFALAPDGRSFFASVRSSGFSGVVRIGARAKSMTRIEAFRDAEGPFLLGHRLVARPESPSPGAFVQMYAAGALSGKPARTPWALRVLRGVSALDTDGRWIAYPSAAFTSLWWSPSLRRPPREILAGRGGNRVDNSVQIGGRYIGFGIQPRLFVADTKTHRYLEIGRHYGWTELNSASLLVDDGARVVLVPLRDLPRIPDCR
jgi:hypothetical protein